MNTFLPSRGRIAVCAAALAAVALASCTPGSEITAEEADVVATFYDRAFDFGAIQSYALPDSVVHVTGDPDDADSPLLSRDYDDEILAEVAGELDALGWTRVTDPATADIVVLVGATASVELSTWYGYWGWYYPYPPGWGWYYPYPTVSYDYTVGTLLMLMTRPGSANPNAETYEVSWVGALNGVLDDSAADKQARISRGIAQAFDQSPYLSGN